MQCDNFIEFFYTDVIFILLKISSFVWQMLLKHLASFLLTVRRDTQLKKFFLVLICSKCVCIGRTKIRAKHLDMKRNPCDAVHLFRIQYYA